jgi:hypothetical protein
MIHLHQSQDPAKSGGNADFKRNQIWEFFPSKILRDLETITEESESTEKNCIIKCLFESRFLSNSN